VAGEPCSAQPCDDTEWARCAFPGSCGACSVHAEEEARARVTGLSGDTRYVAYTVAGRVDGDDGSNKSAALQPRPTRVTLRTADSRPPAWARPPAAAAVAVRAAAVTAALDEPGMVFFVVLPRGASAPSPLELLAGTGAEGATAAACGAIRVSQAQVATTHVFNWTTTTEATAAVVVGEERRCSEPLGAGLDARVLHRLTQRANGVEAHFSWGDVAAADALRPQVSLTASPPQISCSMPSTGAFGGCKWPWLAACYHIASSAFQPLLMYRWCCALQAEHQQGLEHSFVSSVVPTRSRTCALCPTLAPDQHYDVYLLAEDDAAAADWAFANNMQPAVTHTTLYTGDFAPPAFVRAVQADPTSPTSLQVVAALDEPGWVYWAVLPVTAVAPDAASLLAASLHGVGLDPPAAGANGDDDDDSSRCRRALYGAMEVTTAQRDVRVAVSGVCDGEHYRCAAVRPLRSRRGKRPPEVDSAVTTLECIYCYTSGQVVRAVSTWQPFSVRSYLPPESVRTGCD
jgi:hypothetical protein